MADSDVEKQDDGEAMDFEVSCDISVHQFIDSNLGITGRRPSTAIFPPP